MSLGQDIDYEALARQHGAISSMPAAAPGKNGEIDYEAIAKQHGAIGSTPAPQAAPNPYQQAAERIPGGTGTSMSAGKPKPVEQSSWFDRFIHAVGIPTSQGETSTAVQNVLTPQPEPGAEGLLKTEESLPVLGSDFRARAALARQGRPTSMLPFLGPAIASFVDSTVGEKPDTATALGSGANVVAQTMGLKSLLTPKAPVSSLEVPTNPPAANVTPTHVEALTGLIEDRGGTVDPHETATAALPTLRETAVRQGIDPSKLKGREAGQATLRVAEQAVRDTQNEFNDIRKPYNSVLVDRSAMAKVYRDAITPDLLENEPKVAKALEAQAKKLDQPAPLEQVNQFRTRMNNRLDAFERQGSSQQLMDDVQTRADAAAANAARDVEYDTVGRLSGLDPEYVRGLKQREGSLIETKRSLTKEYNRASGSQGEAVSKGVREKVANTYPSPRGVKHAGIRELIGPKPIDVLNNRLSKMFAGMGSAGDLPSYEQVQPPAAPQIEGGSSGPLPGGEDAIDEATRGGPGSPPPTAPDTSQTFSRGGRMGTPQGIADQVVAAKSGSTANATARVDAHKVAKAAIGSEVQAPVAPVTTATGQITPEHVASENAFYTQARAELGANASPSAVLQRAQALKIEYTAKGAAPPVTPVTPPKPVISQGNYTEDKVITLPGRGSIHLDTKMMHPDIAGELGYKAVETIHPEVPENLRGQGYGKQLYEAAFEHARDIGADKVLSEPHNMQSPEAIRTWESLMRTHPDITKIDDPILGKRYLFDLSKSSVAAKPPTLTQKMQAQPLPTLRRVTPPTAPGGTTSASPQQQATALMLLVKQGKLTPAEADSKIKRLVGPGGHRLIRRPVGPE